MLLKQSVQRLSLKVCQIFNAVKIFNRKFDARVVFIQIMIGRQTSTVPGRNRRGTI